MFWYLSWLRAHFEASYTRRGPCSKGIDFAGYLTYIRFQAPLTVMASRDASFDRRLSAVHWWSLLLVGDSWLMRLGWCAMECFGIPTEWLHETVIDQLWLHGDSMMDEFMTTFDFSGWQDAWQYVDWMGKWFSFDLKLGVQRPWLLICKRLERGFGELYYTLYLMSEPLHLRFLCLWWLIAPCLIPRRFRSCEFAVIWYGETSVWGCLQLLWDFCWSGCCLRSFHWLWAVDDMTNVVFGICKGFCSFCLVKTAFWMADGWLEMFWKPDEMFREDCRLDCRKANLNLTMFDTMWPFISKVACCHAFGWRRQMEERHWWQHKVAKSFEDSTLEVRLSLVFGVKTDPFSWSCEVVLGTCL